MAQEHCDLSSAHKKRLFAQQTIPALAIQLEKRKKKKESFIKC